MTISEMHAGHAWFFVCFGMVVLAAECILHPICMTPCQEGAGLLCAGNNHLSKLDRMMYLRQFKSLELVNLAGNPLCREANYRAYMLSHIKCLKFLDYVRVNPDDLGAAFEHYQVWPFTIWAFASSAALLAAQGCY